MRAVRAVLSTALIEVLNESVVFSTVLSCSHGFGEEVFEGRKKKDAPYYASDRRERA